MAHLPSMRALAVVAAVLSIGAAWRVGLWQGRHEAPAAGAALPAASDALTSRVMTLERERDTALATAETLRMRLSEAERRSVDDAAELALYRSIGSAAERSGLGIDTIELSREPSGRDELRITLVQSRGRDRVAGTLGATLLAGDADAERRIELVPGEGEGAVPFDLRFFETLVVPLDDTLVGDAFEPERLAIAVTPTSGRQPAFIDILDWDTIVEASAGE